MSVLHLQYYTGIAFIFKWYLIGMKLLSDDLSMFCPYQLRLLYNLISVSTTKLLLQRQQNSLETNKAKLKISILSGHLPTNNRYMSNNLIWQVNLIKNEKVHFKSKSSWKDYPEIIITKVSYFFFNYLWPCEVFSKFSFENLTLKMILFVLRIKTRR